MKMIIGPLPHMRNKALFWDFNLTRIRALVNALSFLRGSALLNWLSYSFHRLRLLRRLLIVLPNLNF